MCGIAGHLSLRPGVAPRVEAVARMCRALAHRGPDASGLEVRGPMALGHRRLSIIDLSPEGNQPLSNEDGSVWVAVNGEIYNHQELRRGLEARGHRFRSRSDSEIVVHLYEDRGPAFLDELRGMFALALWDARASRLLLARDRVGKKPLYWAQRPDGITFASELPALLEGLDRRPEPDLAAIDHYLSLQYVPAPLTAFQGVAKLPAAHRLICEAGGAPRVERYWRLRFDAPETPPPRERDAVAEVRSLLEDAVRVRMVADVPVGAFLSGGVDSSAVVALMARASGQRVKTFSIDFPGGAGEVEYARLVARRYDTDHHELQVRPHMTDVLPDLVRRYGEPFADSSAVPVFHLSQLTRAHVTVALSGDGSDESFAGYRRYLWHRLARGLEHAPAAARLARAALGHLPGARGEALRRFAAYLGRPRAESYLQLVAHFGPRAKEDIRGPALREGSQGGDPVVARFAALLDEAGGTDEVNRLLALDVETYLPDDILVKVDIASMAHALEVRAPFLDHLLMEHLARLPGSMKLRWLRGKRVLRRAIADLVPAPILRRRKKGFALPVDGWIRGELRDMTHDLLTGRACRERGIVDPAAVDRLLAEHDAGAAHGERIWNLLVLEQWFRTFVDGGTAGAQAGAAPAALAR